MIKQDEQELHRLTKILETVHGQVGNDASADEALRKAALALCVSFSHGLRPEVESEFDKLGKPLTDLERERLRNMGIDPD